MTLPAGAGRPQCVDGPPTDDPHDIDGPHTDRCNEHHAAYRRWRRAANTYAHRQAAAAPPSDRPFEVTAARRQRQLDKPYRPRVRSSRARGLLPIDRSRARELRASRQALTGAAVPVNLAYRDEAPPGRRDLRRLLDALDKHTALLDRLLAGVADT